MSGWGSGWAQGTGGRVRTPAPTKYGKLSGLSVGAGPRPARRMKGKISRYGGRGKPLPDSFTEALPDWVGEALGPPAGGCACQESTLIRLASGQTPSPFQGEGLSGRVWDPPLRRMTKTVSRLRRGRSQTGPPGFAPGALAEKSQAQVWNRVGCNFCTPRARWPGLNGEKALRFCAPERFCLPQGVTPVMGSGADSPCQGEMSRSDRGDRVGDYEHEVLIWSRPRRRFG